MTSLISAAMKSQDPMLVHEKYPERGTLRYYYPYSRRQFLRSQYSVANRPLTRSAMDNISNRIRVNCVCPT